MKAKPIKVTAVVGAGTMGLGIAQVFASYGFHTLLFDQSTEVLNNAAVALEKSLDKAIHLKKLEITDKLRILKNIILVEDIHSIKADLIVEAVVENVEIKQEVFKELEKINSHDTIFATNTSSIPITRIAGVLKHSERFIGLHFFNPVHTMNLVEIVPGVPTSEKVIQFVKSFVKSIGKEPVISQDAPGFIVNRIARHFYVESLKIVEDQVADIDTVDKLIENYGFKMGPFRLMDLIGVDTNYSVTQSMFEAFNYEPKFRPSRLQYQKVLAGHFGKKTGKGFYEYPE